MRRYANSARAGLLDKLRGLRDRHPLIGDVRGIGLMIGVEIVRDRDTHAPAGAERERIVRGAFEKGLRTLPCGKPKIRPSPPLACTDADAGESQGPQVENEDASHVRRYGLSSLRIARANASGRAPMARDQQSSDPHSRAIATDHSVAP